MHQIYGLFFRAHAVNCVENVRTTVTHLIYFMLFNGCFCVYECVCIIKHCTFGLSRKGARSSGFLNLNVSLFEPGRCRQHMNIYDVLG